MLSHGLDKRRLRPLVPLSFRKPHLLALAQIIESVIGDAVAVKVDVAAIAACDEAVVRFGVQFRDRAVRRGLVFLHMPAAPADDILKLAACSFESIADRHVNVLVRAGRGRFAADHDIGGIGNHKMDPDVIDVTLVMAVLRPGHDNARADDPAEKLLKLLRFFSDARLNGV